AETLDLMVAAMTGMVADMAIQTEAMARAAGSGFSTATDLADWLVRELGLPFRDAHHITGRAVALADERKVDLSDLPLVDLQEIHPEITDQIYNVLTVASSVA